VLRIKGTSSSKASTPCRCSSCAQLSQQQTLPSSYKAQKQCSLSLYRQKWVFWNCDNVLKASMGPTWAAISTTNYLLVVDFHLEAPVYSKPFRLQSSFFSHNADLFYHWMSSLQKCNKLITCVRIRGILETAWPWNVLKRRMMLWSVEEGCFDLMMKWFHCCTHWSITVQ
jgi:hypothetical protein